MSIDYSDKRFDELETKEQKELNKVDKTYDKMIDSSEKFYQDQIDAAVEYGDTQTKNQQEQTDFAIDKIEQQKNQAQKDYQKEQSAAYADWQKESNPYGVNAEKMAANGLTGSGYSESARVEMYNTYQNRVVTAKESYDKAVLEYDNMIKDAKLQNNALLAEIAYNTLQTKLTLALEGFQYENSLIIAKEEKETAVKDKYYTRYQDIVNQINTENALAEEKRQFNETMAFNKSKTISSNEHSDESSVEIVKDGNNGDDNTPIAKFKKSVLSKEEFKNKAGGIAHYNDYIYKQLELAYTGGEISEPELNELLDEYGF